MKISAQHIWSLVQAYRNGDNNAISSIIQHYKGSLLKTSYRYLKDYHRAEDAIQDVSLKLLNIPKEDRKQRFNPKKNYVLATIQRQITNRSIDIYRSKVRRRVIDINEAFHYESKSNKVESFIATDEMQCAIQYAVTQNKLNKEQLSIFNLYLDGYQAAEIDKELNLSNGRATKVQYRTKRKIQQIILKLRQLQ